MLLLRVLFLPLSMLTVLAGCNTEQLLAAQLAVNSIAATDCKARGGVWQVRGSSGFCQTFTPSVRTTTPAPVAAPVAARASSKPQGQSANRCVSVSSPTSNPGAFFKAKMTNNCSTTIWVSFCPRAQCGQTARFYNSAETLRPGASVPVDPEGQGIRWASCFYTQPDYFTPRSTSPGKFVCD